MKRVTAQALRDIECSYELKWEPSTKHSAAPQIRAIDVEPKTPGLRLLYPNLYFEGDLPVDGAYRIAATERALTYPLEANGIVFSLGAQRRSAGLDMRVQFSTSQIAFVTESGTHHALVDVIWAWFDASGTRIRGGDHDEIKLAIPDIDFGEFQRREHVVDRNLSVPEHAVELRIAVRDAHSGSTGSKILSLSTLTAPSSKPGQ